MIIVYLEKIIAFAKNHSNARKSLSTWKSATQNASWKKKQDVLRDFPKAKMITNNRARFEIFHNTYRLVIKINYDGSIVEVRFIGTHNEYDRINPGTI